MHKRWSLGVNSTSARDIIVKNTTVQLVGLVRTARSILIYRVRESQTACTVNRMSRIYSRLTDRDKTR